MARIVGVESVFPRNRYSQREIMDVIQAQWPEHAAVFDRLVGTSSVEHRSFVQPLDRYPKLGGFGERNAIYLEAMMELLEKAIRGLQSKTGFDWKDVRGIISTTITGIAVPSLDARLMNRLPLGRDLVRIPLFGLGCMGGVASLNRANDFLEAYPDRLALVLASEACSLTFQLNDSSMANFVATSLFGDGAAAVLLAGEDHPLARGAGIQIQAGASSFYPDSERVMGWDMVDSGFKIVLSGSVPDIVKKYVGDDVATFLHQQSLELAEIKNIVSHPGGPKVLQALSESLQQPNEAFKHSWDSLRDHGNLSSVSVLNVLQRSIEQKTLKPGPTLALAMGPAFNSEVSLWEVAV